MNEEKNNEEKNNEEKNVVDSLSLESQVKKLTLEVNDLRYKIKGLEKDLDDVSEELEQAMRVKKAVLEIEDYLNKKHNGFEAHYFPTLTYSKK